MRPTKQYVEEKFAIYNNMLFGGKLPIVPVRISQAKCFVGKLKFKERHPFLRGKEYYDFILYINSRFDYPEDVIEDTIIHEMIHLYILYKGIEDTSPHGEVFKKIMNTINEKYNRNITISRKTTEKELNTDSKKKHNMVGLSQMKDGLWGVTVTKSPWIFEINRAFKSSSQIRQINWYLSTNVFFNKYPSSRTPKLYRITKEDIDLHIKDARLLEIDGHKVTFKS